MMTRAYVKSAMDGHYGAELPGFEDAQRIAQTAPLGDGAPSHLDRAEAPLHKIQAGDRVSLSRGVDIVGRDGFRIHLTKGTAGQVQRDMEGDGRFFAVFVPDAGHTVRVPGAYLTR